MSSGPDDWTPQLGQPDGREFKWGIDGSSGELTVWEVGGPGDGLPIHAEVLTNAWGRDDHYRPGDLLGAVWVESEQLTVVVYFVEPPAEVPPPLRDWASRTFPAHTVRLADPGHPPLGESAAGSSER